MNNTNVKTIKVDKRGIFKYWLEFLKPYHKLRKREIEALGIMLYYRNELKSQVSNIDLVEKLLFSKDIRDQIRADLGDMDQKVFNNLLTSLRSSGVLSRDNKILPALIPNIDDNEGFRLIFNFELKKNETQ